MFQKVKSMVKSMLSPWNPLNTCDAHQKKGWSFQWYPQNSSRIIPFWMVIVHHDFTIFWMVESPIFMVIYQIFLQHFVVVQRFNQPFFAEPEQPPGRSQWPTFRLGRWPRFASASPVPWDFFGGISCGKAPWKFGIWAVKMVVQGWYSWCNGISWDFNGYLMR